MICGLQLAFAVLLTLLLYGYHAYGFEHLPLALRLLADSLCAGGVPRRAELARRWAGGLHRLAGMPDTGLTLGVSADSMDARYQAEFVRRLYQRLGFRVVSGEGVYLALVECSAAPRASPGSEQPQTTEQQQ